MVSLLRTYTHKYDIRGKLSKRFGNKEAQLIGRGFGTIVGRDGARGLTVVVGRDVRESSADLCRNLVEGLVESGANVIDVGICTTPMLRFGSLLYNSSGSVMVTASHNSLDDNGFKFTLNSLPFYDENLQRMCDLIEGERFKSGLGSITYMDIRKTYIQNLLKGIRINDKIRVGWIAQHELLDSLLADILTQLPGQHMISSSVNGFAKFSPDVIFDFDTDVDRMVMLEGNGRQWHGDETLGLFAMFMKQERDGLKVVFDLKSSRVLMAWLESIGIECHLSRVGSCFIDKKMRDVGADLGGELSGHYMFSDYNYLSDDGIYAALRMIHYLCTIPGHLQEIRHIFPKVHISKSIKIHCGECGKVDMLERMKDSLSSSNLVLDENEEGAIMVQHAEGWYIIRTSETENMMSVRCEGFDEYGLEIIQGKVDSLLATVGLSIW